MSNIKSLLSSKDISPALEAEAPAERELAEILDMRIYPRSIVANNGVVYCMAASGINKRLALLTDKSNEEETSRFHGEERDANFDGKELLLRLCPLNASNAQALRETLPFCAPKALGISVSMGCGDRLGLATPAHVRAIRGTGVAPIFAQQSIREMDRTGRTPTDVMNSASWGVFEEGWREGFGSDADHLKTAANIERCAAAGFTMFTIDPGDHVDEEAQTADIKILAVKYEALPWDALDVSPEKSRKTFVKKDFRINDEMSVSFTEEQFLRAAAKYGRAIAHTAKMYRHLVSVMGDRPFELEISVDETQAPTTPAEHFYVASELKRLGVKWVSLAPRFIGEFEKGIDYKGSLDAFEAAFKEHVAIAQYLGPYKISLHSGSDKFSIYPIAARVAGDLIHLKTAGTSYLEATRAIAKSDPALFREILAFALDRYDTDRATYHVSAERKEVTSPDKLADDELSDVLASDAGRQVLHVTYGSVLTAQDEEGGSLFKERFIKALRENEEVHYEVLADHIRRHVDPISPNYR